MEMRLYDVIRKINGEINPIGDSSVDAERYENLLILCETVNKLVSDIDAVAYINKGSYEYSRKKAAKYASDFLTKLLE